MFQNSSGTRPVGPPDIYLASPFFPCKWRWSFQSSFGKTLPGTRDNKASCSCAGERRGSPCPGSEPPLKSCLEQQMPRQKVHLKGGNIISSFVDTGVLPGHWRSTVQDCAQPGIVQQALLSEASSGGHSVYVLTIFGNANRRGQWLSSGWEKAIPDL